MAEMRLWVFTFRQFRDTKFSILSIVSIYVTPWIALLMRKYFLCQFLKFWIATAYLQCDIFSTKSHSGFRWPALLHSSRWPCRPRICALHLVSGNQFSISGTFGLFSEAWQTQRGMDGSGWVRCWWLDQNTGDIAKKCHQLLRPTHCVTSG